MSDVTAKLRVGLLFSMLLLLPFGSTLEFALLVCAVIGIFDGWKHRALVFHDASGRLLSLLFLAYWLPELGSAADSVAPEKSWLEVATDLRFLPFGWFVLVTFQHARARSWLLSATALLVLLWTFDALLQASVGFSLGGRMQSDRVSGIFSDDNLKLGPVLAALAPLSLWMTWKRWRWVGLTLAWLVIAIAVLLAGARAAWLSFIIVTAILTWKTAGSPRRFLRIGAATAMIGMLVFAGSYAMSDRLQARVDRSLQALRGTEASWDTALAYRLPIWTVSVRMVVDHPINGVGVRAFRYAYADYAEPDDIWLTTPSGYAMHAHQIVLEILTETGVIGLLFWLGGAALVVRQWRRASNDVREQALPWGIALVSMCFPINTHLAFYSNFWGTLFWWLLAIFAASLSARDVQRSHLDRAIEDKMVLR